jgi:hypothetical protein
MIKVDKDIPIPPRRLKYPWSTMEVGDSFFVPGKNSQSFGNTVQHARRTTGRTFTARKVEGGLRIWRTS